MKKLGIVVGILFALGLFGVIWRNVVRETPEQLAARRNLEILDEIVAAWEAHRAEPRESLLDEQPYQKFAVELRRIDLTDASVEVKAVHGRYVKYAADAPKVFEQFKTPPAEAP